MFQWRNEGRAAYVVLPSALYVHERYALNDCACAKLEEDEAQEMAIVCP